MIIAEQSSSVRLLADTPDPRPSQTLLEPLLFQDLIERESCDSEGEGRGLRGSFQSDRGDTAMIQVSERLRGYGGTRTLVSQDLMSAEATVKCVRIHLETVT